MKKDMPALGFEGYRIRSQPLSIEDATLKLQAIEVVEALGDQVEPKDIVEAVNQVAGLHLKISASAPTLQDRFDQQQAEADAARNAGMPGHTMDAKGNIVPINAVPKAPTGPKGVAGPSASGGITGKISPPKPPTVLNMKAGGAPQRPGQGGAAKKSDEPATGHELAVRMMSALRKRDFEELALLLPIVHSFDAAGCAAFNEIVGELQFLDTSYDPQGLAELSACTVAVMTGQPHDHAH